MAVPGTSLTFDLPKIAAGKPDNGTGDGQIIPLDLGKDVTQLSLIGTANEKAQDTVGTLTWSDGTTTTIPIQFGDWTASVATPKYGNILVAQSDGRFSGGSSSNSSVAGIFSTAPVILPTPTSKASVISLTLPKQTGSTTATGRIHVFAVATNGTRLAIPELTVSPSTVTAALHGVALSAQLATASGGRLAESANFTATVNWGDGSATTDGSGGANGVVSGTHTWASAGQYTVTVVVDDASASASTTIPVTVK